MMGEMIRERYPFRLNATHTRLALEALQERFPIVEERLPMGIELLFNVLGRLGLDEVIPYGEMLEERELHLLATFFNRAHQTKVILAVALILASRKDSRSLQAVRRWMHYMPPMAELSYLRQVWNSRGFRELFAGEVPWMHELMTDRKNRPLVAFFLERIDRGAMQLSDLVMGLPDEVTPLIQTLEMEIFARGGLGLAQISPARAFQLAERFLKGGREDAVRAYFIHCPESNWPMSLIRLVHNTLGPPDPSRHPFYAAMPKGVIWGIRRQLFQTLIGEGEFDGRRTTFWMRYLHHAQEVVWQDGTLVITIQPLKIYELKASTEVILGGQTERRMVFRLDGMWEREMTDLLNDYIQWGQAR